MKTLVTSIFVVAILVLGSLTSQAFAGGKDTLVVYASGASLDEVINSDTTASGMQAHSVYKLVSLDSTYLYMGPATVKSNLTVIGVLGPDGRPPCIQPGTLEDGSMGSILFDLNGNNTVGTFKNLYIFELSMNNSWDWGKDFLITADSVSLYLDNVIVDENRGEIIAYTGVHDKFFVTNCKFRNGVYPSDWFSSIVLTADWPTSNPADTIIMKYCTVFCLDANTLSPSNSQPLKYLEFTHNSLLYSFTQPLNIGTVLHAKIDNNIFYAQFTAGGADKLFLSKDGGMVDLDTVDAVTDLTRIIEIKNNVYFEPKVITDFWAQWNDTSKTDSIFVPHWLNTKTQKILADKTKWPGIVEAGTYLNVDPGYGASFQTITNNTTTNPTVGLLQYIAEVKNGTITTDDWGYMQQTVSGDNWIPQWPLPETSDMKYSNATLITGGTDGLPVGDPYWFSGKPTAVKGTQPLVPGKFALSEAYPNPFNPSTTIKINLAHAGNVTLNVYNVMGQLVKTVINNEYKAQGESTYRISMNNMASGIYFYTLTQGSQSLTKKMLLVK